MVSSSGSQSHSPTGLVGFWFAKYFVLNFTIINHNQQMTWGLILMQVTYTVWSDLVIRCAEGFVNAWRNASKRFSLNQAYFLALISGFAIQTLSQRSTCAFLQVDCLKMSMCFFLTYFSFAQILVPMVTVKNGISSPNKSVLNICPWVIYWGWSTMTFPSFVSPS